MAQEAAPAAAPVAPPALSAEEANAAVARGAAAGKELAEQLMRGDATPGRLFEAVQQRYTTLAGLVEVAGLLHVIANVVQVFQPTVQAAAQQAATKTAEITTSSVANAVFNAVHAQQATYLEGVDKALRDIHAAYVHDSKHAAAPFFVPSLPPKPKRVTFEVGADGAITGAVLRS